MSKAGTGSNYFTLDTRQRVFFTSPQPPELDGPGLRSTDLYLRTTISRKHASYLQSWNFFSIVPLLPALFLASTVRHAFAYGDYDLHWRQSGSVRSFCIIERT